MNSLHLFWIYLICIKYNEKEIVCLEAFSECTFGSESIYLNVREYVCDYMIEHKERFSEIIEDDIDEYISKMLLDDEWEGFTELVDFSEIYYVPIQVFGSIRFEDRIIRI